MEKVEFSDINKKIDDLFEDKSEYIFSTKPKTPKTPTISDFRIEEATNKNICQSDDRNKNRYRKRDKVISFYSISKC